MQWKWKAWLQTPHATVHSSLVALAWFAWHSMQRSIMWFLQIAQLSTTISHAQRATAFHFLISNRLIFLEEVLGPAWLLEPSPVGSGIISTSVDAIKPYQISQFKFKTTSAISQYNHRRCSLEFQVIYTYTQARGHMSVFQIYIVPSKASSELKRWVLTLL